MTTYTIDASGKKLGRVASEAAKLLMGKNLASFAREHVPLVSLRIQNVSKLSISDAKRKNKKYPYFSGYQGGLRFETLDALGKRRGYTEVVRHAIKGMLPSNKLRPGMMKRLVISE